MDKRKNKSSNKSKRVGYFWIILSLLYFIPLILIVSNSVKNKNTFNIENIFFFLVFVILFGGILSSQLIHGIRRLRNK